MSFAKVFKRWNFPYAIQKHKSLTTNKKKALGKSDIMKNLYFLESKCTKID